MAGEVSYGQNKKIGGKDMNTALRAEQEKAMIFISEAHEKFYYEKLKEVRCEDEYHKALVYCLGICNDTREHIYRIYDFKSGLVKPECLRESWQTSGSAKVVRMAFNLYCNAMPSVEKYRKKDEQLKEAALYSVEELFYCSYAPFFLAGSTNLLSGTRSL